MKRKLLNKTLGVYIIYSLIVMVISAPTFYFITEKMLVHETDERLRSYKKEFIHSSLPNLKEIDLPVWNKMNRDMKIEPSSGIDLKDKYFFQKYREKEDHEKYEYRVLSTPIEIEGKIYIYTVKMNLVESEDLSENIFLLFFFILVLLLSGLFIITKIFSNKIWAPFYSSLQYIEQFEIDKNYQSQWPQTKIIEFDRLNHAINNLMVRNIEIYKSQQEFIENAAHELQTPLAVFQAKLDSLSQDPELSQGQSAILQQLIESASRLNRLNRNLLLLSKIDQSHYKETSEVSIDAIISKQLDFFTEQAVNKNISIMPNILQPDIVNANPVLIEMMISNLLMNSIRHNIPDGIIRISLQNNVLTIANTGNAEPLPEEKLFKRFSKVNPSAMGNGLGLSIVKKITELYHFKVKYFFINNMHNFEIKF